jgi:hypothetical protein
MHNHKLGFTNTQTIPAKVIQWGQTRWGTQSLVSSQRREETLSTEAAKDISILRSLYQATNSEEITLRVKVILRPTVSRPVCLGVKHQSGTQIQIFITVRQLPVCWYGAPSLTRGRVSSLQFLLALFSAVILGSESRGNHDHILLPQIRDSPTWRAKSPYLCPGQGGSVPLYIPRH